MPAYVIVTSMKRTEPDAYPTFEKAVLEMGEVLARPGNNQAVTGIQLSHNVILIRNDWNLERMKLAVAEHLHTEDDLVILEVADGTGVFSQDQVASLLHQALKCTAKRNNSAGS